MLDKNYYQDNKEEFDRLRNKVKKDPFLPAFHIYPEAGWLNDPNGLCQFDGNYHIYYQYSPFDENKKEIAWGHVISDDFINFSYEDPFIYPDSKYDRDGAYSGSAFIENEEINFFYTGNVKHEGDFDYINSGRDHNTMKIRSSDGMNFSKKELILTNEDSPEDITKHVRDPKIYKENEDYYMFLGARSKEDKGMVLVYKSSDLKDFSYHMRIESKEKFGYMWECPDYFFLDGEGILITCPQGVRSEEYRYQNIYQAGYFPLDIDFPTKTYSLGDFKELDYGFDFYAPQTFEDDQERRILIGWMGMPDATYTNPTTEYKWQHCLTIPRKLIFRDGKLYQEPVKELEKLRGEKLFLEKTRCYKGSVFEAISEDINSDFSIKLREDVSLTYTNGILSLDMGKSSYGRDKRKLKVESIFNLRIYSDRSSLEIFINDGAYVLTSRVYSEEYVFSSTNLDFDLFSLSSIKFN